MLKNNYKYLPIALTLLILSACAGTEVIQQNRSERINPGSLIIAFPFRDPSLFEKKFPGIGGKFTQSFTAAASKYNIDIIPVSSDVFRSDQDLDVFTALEFAKEKNADYIVIGHVTKWVDRATEWSGKRDYAGLGISIRALNTGKIVATGEFEEYSNGLWSGTPDDFIVSLSQSAAEHFFGPEGK